MRVLLVQAPSVEGPSSEVVAPLGLAMVAAAARNHGHAVELLDLNAGPEPFSALNSALSRIDPQVVGVGLRNIDPLANRRHSFLPAFGAVLEVLRDALPEAPLVVGGAGYSMFPRIIMERYPEIDLGVMLEGEVTFPEVLKRLEAGDTTSRLAGSPGTLVRTHDGSLISGPPRPRVTPEHLDAARPWLPELAARYRDRTAYAPAAGVETKRGCPLACSYCVYPALQGRRLRFRRPETIVAEIEVLHREAGVDWIHFTDPVLNVPPGHFREICRLLLARRIPVRWTGFFRENTLTPSDAELAVRAGCAAFQFSGDGTCDHTLARLNKGYTLDALLAAARAVSATEALAVYHFMVNVPGTDAAVAEGARVLVDRIHDIHARRANLGAMVFNNLRVYPGTPLAKELRVSGVLRRDDTLLYPTYHDPVPFQELRYELEERHQRRSCFWNLERTP